MKMNKFKPGDFKFKNYKVRLGLGRMAAHHPREYVVRASDEGDAIQMAKNQFYRDVRAEVGDNPILHKILSVESVQEVS